MLVLHDDYAVDADVQQSSSPPLVEAIRSQKRSRPPEEKQPFGHLLGLLILKDSAVFLFDFRDGT
jgi:hypothetical protein